MDAKSNDCVVEMFDRWQAQDHELERYVDQLCEWMQEVSQFGIPHFGETASRLRPLRRQLLDRFQCKDEIVSELAEMHPTEVDGVPQHSIFDCTQLLSRIDDLIRRLEQIEPPFASWEAAIDDVTSVFMRSSSTPRTKLNVSACY